MDMPYILIQLASLFACIDGQAEDVVIDPDVAIVSCVESVDSKALMGLHAELAWIQTLDLNGQESLMLIENEGGFSEFSLDEGGAASFLRGLFDLVDFALAERGE